MSLGRKTFAAWEDTIELACGSGVTLRMKTIELSLQFPGDNTTVRIYPETHRWMNAHVLLQ